MRILLLLLLVLNRDSFAQEWSLFPVNNTLNYQVNGKKYITNTLTAMPITINTDKLFIVTKSLLPYDSCKYSPYGCYSYQSDFLSEKYKINADKTVTLYWQNDSALLYTNREKGFRWNYNDRATAEISSSSYNLVLSDMDSTKTILFSTGDSMIISKNNGVILFKHPSVGYVHLVGNQNRETGLKLMDYSDFNILGIGDYFRTSETIFEGSGGFECTNRYTRIYKITKIDTISADELEYICDEKEYASGYFNCSDWTTRFSYTSRSKGVSVYVNLKNNFQPNRLTSNESFFYDTLKSVSGYLTQNNNVLITESNSDNKGCDNVYYLKEVTEDSNVYKRYKFSDRYFSFYTYPVSLKQSCELRFESSYEFIIDGYTRNGISYGLTDTNIFLGIEDTRKIQMSVQPIPNNGSFTINFHDKVYSDFIRVQIVDLTGKVVFDEEFENNETLNVNANFLHNGVYVIKVVIDQHLSTHKLIITQNTSQ